MKTNQGETMQDMEKKCKVAVVQASTVPFDKNGALEKTLALIDKAAGQHPDLIVFPEAFIPAYPRGFSFGYVVGSRTMEGREDWKIYYDNAVIVPSADTEAIGAAAKRAGAYVALGVTERDSLNCTLYCTLLYFGPDGRLLGKHRKLKPTGSERLIWGEGTGDILTTIPTKFGVIGGLICWENYMPLARVALYQQGVAIYLAPTADNREEWQATLRHIALEGRCFVIGCNQYETKSMIPQIFKNQEELAKVKEDFCPGGSCVVDPFGKYLVEPIWNREEIAFAELSMDLVPLSRMDFDPTGHYARPDVLELIVHKHNK